jgi:hypothetical protein
MGSVATLGSSLALLHDYRSGHCANLSGYFGGYGAGAVNGTLGRFRTGYGFETSHDFAGGGADLSLGYIRVADGPPFFPPVDGLCIGASYIQSNAALECQIIGQGGDAFGNISWQLRRSATHIHFTTSDGVATSTFSYAIAAVPGQVESIAVRYTGGVGANNCTIYVIAPTFSFSTGQIDRVPQDVAQPVSVGCYSTSAEKPFMGTMRYVVFLRGAQTMTVLTDLAAEIEDTQWATEISHCDNSGSIADRAVQYMSKFGVDASIASEGGAIPSRISNSEWETLDVDGRWRVAPFVCQHLAGTGTAADVQKMLWCWTAGRLKLPVEYFSMTPAVAAYGAWDFWLYHSAGGTEDVFVVYDANGANDDGYMVRVGAADISLNVISGGVLTALVTAAGVVGVVGELIHIRVTRTAGNAWKLFYQICNTARVPGNWVYVGTANDASIVTSEGMLLDFEGGGQLLLGNHRSEKALLKWRGVVNPR